MKIHLCYSTEGLKKLLTNHEFRCIRCISESEEWATDGKKFYFVSPDVDHIITYSSTFSKTLHIVLKNGEHISAYADNMNSHNTELIRINSNPYVCPTVQSTNDFIEATPLLTAWIKKFYNCTDEELQAITVELVLEEYIEYPGVPTPIPTSTGHYAYSNTPLILTEHEIESVLNGIDNELLRKKIDCVLHARVFKRKV